MCKTQPEAVVFHAGEYRIAAKCGSATVTIPRDIRLGEINHALAKLFKGGKR